MAARSEPVADSELDSISADGRAANEAAKQALVVRRSTERGALNLGVLTGWSTHLF